MWTKSGVFVPRMCGRRPSFSTSPLTPKGRIVVFCTPAQGTPFGTGTQAAVVGGTTTVIDFCSQTRGQSPLVGLEDWRRRAASACVDVGPHMIMLGAHDQSLTCMQT